MLSRGEKSSVIYLIARGPLVHARALYRSETDGPGALLFAKTQSDINIDIHTSKQQTLQ